MTALYSPSKEPKAPDSVMQQEEKAIDGTGQDQATSTTGEVKHKEIVLDECILDAMVEPGQDLSELNNFRSLDPDPNTAVGNALESELVDLKDVISSKEPPPLEAAINELRTAYTQAKKVYRIHPDRLARIRSSLSRYVGTHNYHNYTVNKPARDPSAKRVIKTFVVDDKPILINDTEWLSLKVHGQSFMMHQIRKMVSMVALVVRCGGHEGRIQDSYTAEKFIIPKAPGLGLLLERPVFDTYNERMRGEEDRGPVSFEKYEKEMNEFKQREIYERIFREEERDNTCVTNPALSNYWEPTLTSM